MSLPALRRPARPANARFASREEAARAVAAAVIDLTATSGWPPSVREVARRVGWASDSSADRALQDAAESGLLRAMGPPGTSRRYVAPLRERPCAACGRR